MGDSGHEEEGEEDEEDEIESEAQRHQSDMEDSEEADSENEEVDSDKDEGEKVLRNGVNGLDGELVKLPCDLPSWDAIRGHLEQLAG